MPAGIVDEETKDASESSDSSGDDEEVVMTVHRRKRKRRQIASDDDESDDESDEERDEESDEESDDESKSGLDKVTTKRKEPKRTSTHKRHNIRQRKTNKSPTNHKHDYHTRSKSLPRMRLRNDKEINSCNQTSINNIEEKQ